MNNASPVISWSRHQRQLLLSLFIAVLGSGVLPTWVSGAGTKPKIAILIADEHYNTEESLPIFAEKFLASKYQVVLVWGSKSEPKGERSVTFDRIDALADANLLLVSSTRRAPRKDQLDAIRKYVASGRPVVGVRTANHAFIISPGNTRKPGFEEWREWDAEVIGGNYTGHHKKGPEIKIAATDPGHPILQGVKTPFGFNSTLYKVSPLRPGAKVLLMGELAGQPTEPIAWLFERKGGGKTFYIAMGTVDDFANPPFTQCLQNAIGWLLQNSAR